MESVPVICGEHLACGQWRAVAERLAGEVAAVRSHLAAIERVLGFAVCPDAAGPACRRCGCAGAALGDAGTPPACPDGLTEREVAVLRLVAAGRSNREAAAALSVSERTVERHLENAYRKVGARNRADAVAYAFRNNLT